MEESTKIVVIGADGQLGTDLIKINKEIISLTIADIDITDAVQTEKVLSKIGPDVVINTAAYHKVDDCEDDPLPAFLVNTFGVRNLAAACKKINAAIVHISTDYVFSGDKGSAYSEEDAPNPQSVYGISKLAGEQMVQYVLPEHYIIRTSGLYGAAGCLGKGGTNFVESMIKRAKQGQSIRVVNDEVLGPTYTKDLASKILEVIKTKDYGVYHITNSNQCSWYEFARAIFQLLGMEVDLFPTTGEEFKAKAKRPKYSVLANDHLKEIGIPPMRSWQDALQAYLKEKAYIS